METTTTAVIFVEIWGHPMVLCVAAAHWWLGVDHPLLLESRALRNHHMLHYLLVF